MKVERVMELSPGRLIRGVLLATLLVCTGVALAQPAPGGGPPPGAGGPPGGGPPPGAGGPPGDGPPAGFNPTPPLPANAPEPPADPRNFDGTWYREGPLEFQIKYDMYGDKTPFNALGQKVMDRRVDSLKQGTPFVNASAKCVPMGQPWQMDLNMPFQIFQSPGRFDVLFEEYHGALQIVMDPAQAPPTGYMGRSVAQWDGNTLVVETSGYKDGIWLDVNGTPASKNAKLTQRIRKIKTDRWFLEVVYILDDPTYYIRPWSWVRAYAWRPDLTIFKEYNCEEQTGAKNGIDPSLVPEPND